jgi:hypothetical protein
MDQSVADTLYARERQAELEALTVVCYADFTDCLLAHQLALSIVVEGPKHKSIIISGSDLCEESLWKKFLGAAYPTEVYQLTDEVEPLARSFSLWLRELKEYCSIKAEADVAWLEQMAKLAVIRLIMHNKYDAYVTRKVRSTFANPSVIGCMATMTTYAQLLKARESITYHLAQGASAAQHLIAQLDATYHHTAPDRLQVPWDEEEEE